MLLGEYNYVIDEKGRLNFPAKFREDMGPNFTVTRWLDDCLVAFPEKKWEAVAEKLSERSMVKSRNIQRFLYAGAMQAEPDKQGRILLTTQLREHAGLTKDVTIIGVGDHGEIWNTDAWRAMQKNMSSEAIEDAMAELEF